MKRTHRVAGVSLFIMTTRSDVQRVLDAFILDESLYWWLHPIERVQTEVWMLGMVIEHWPDKWFKTKNGCPLKRT